MRFYKRNSWFDQDQGRRTVRGASFVDALEAIS